MKVLGIVGSNRRNGNTKYLVSKALEGVESLGISTELIDLLDYNYNDCIGCEGCKESYKCIINDDFKEIYKLIEEYDAVVLGSPTYYYNVSAKVKAFLDRLYCYNAFDEENRSVWISINEAREIKYAVTIAVCEQDNEEDMGFTSVAMSKSLEAVGYRCVSNLKILHAFKRNDASNNRENIEKAFESGIKLGKTLVLRENVKAKLSSKKISK